MIKNAITVAQLIDKLRELDPNAIVFYDHDDRDSPVTRKGFAPRIGRGRVSPRRQRLEFWDNADSPEQLSGETVPAVLLW